MAIADDLRKTFTDPTPLYFAAGTADLAFQQAKKVPELVEQIRAEAPARIEAVRRTDPKQVQDRATARAKDVSESVQNVVSGVLGSLDTDIKRLGESAQGFALRGVGVAVEYAVKARETYERVAEHGEQTVRTWRGEASENAASTPAVAPVERPKPVVVRDEPSGTAGTKPTGSAGTKSTGSGRSATTSRTTRTTRTGQTSTSSASSATSPASSATSTSSPSSTTSASTASSEAAKKPAAKKTTARRNGTSSRKTTPRDK
ncbi:hypothetical protein [Streptomyces odontomachi]|uniref:hypothetical protein n=1 Tax=Streptomyces odontomachi TaxID=2944940 RepID=UPI00210D990E|nr:hypothetical protein [Streptomyces sp. ODS25]